MTNAPLRKLVSSVYCEKQIDTTIDYSTKICGALNNEIKNRVAKRQRGGQRFADSGGRILKDELALKSSEK